jgi:RNA polymerase sigma factor (sigma-70 family)
MSPPLEALLEKLQGGDQAAAEQIFLSYEPFLRMVVRRQMSPKLRAKFDSIDVVQSVWADVVRGFRSGSWHFTDAAHLRAFLVKVTRNRFLNQVRHHRFSLEHEQPLAGAAGVSPVTAAEARPSETARASELWQQMLALCPPAHREILHLKRQGLPLSEIAARTGLHKGSVRRILYDLAKRLASQNGSLADPPNERDPPTSFETLGSD